MANSNREAQVARVTQIIERLYLLSSEVFEARARQFDLSIQQMGGLLAIEKLGPKIAIVDVSRATKMPPSTLTGITNRLVDLGLIERERPPDDRRTVRVSITETGREVVSEITDVQKKMLTAVLDGMQSDQVDQFIETFTAFLDSFDEQNTSSQ